jgi:hypothetical protein
MGRTKDLFQEHKDREYLEKEYAHEKELLDHLYQTEVLDKIIPTDGITVVQSHRIELLDPKILKSEKEPLDLLLNKF